MSFGPWDSLVTIEGWRRSDAFCQSVVAMRELLESFEPWTLEVVVHGAVIVRS